MMIELTNDCFDKFWLNITLIKTIVPLMGNKSQINLTTGSYVVCLEDNRTVAEMVNRSIDRMGLSDEET